MQLNTNLPDSFDGFRIVYVPYPFKISRYTPLFVLG